MFEAILHVLLAIGPDKADRQEPGEAREVRLTPVARAIAAHVATDIEAALVLASGTHESRWSSRIGPTGLGDRGLSVGYLQPQRKTCPGAWVADPEAAVDASVECAVKLYRNGWASCRTPGGAFMRYNGSASCVPAAWTKGRESTFYWSLQRLRRYDISIPSLFGDLSLRYDPPVIVLRLPW